MKMGRLTSHPKSVTKTSRCVVLVRNGETVAEDEYDEETVPSKAKSRKRRRRRTRKQLQQQQQHQLDANTPQEHEVGNGNGSTSTTTSASGTGNGNENENGTSIENEEKDSETMMAKKRHRRKKTSSPEQATTVRRSQRRTTQGLSDQVLDFETEVRWEEQELFDCCFIKVTGKVYNRWKELKSKLQFTRDEQLVLYFMDKHKEFAKLERSSSTPFSSNPSELLTDPDGPKIKEEDIDHELSKEGISQNSHSADNAISETFVSDHSEYDLGLRNDPMEEADEDRDLLSIRNEKRLQKLRDEALLTTNEFGNHDLELEEDEEDEEDRRFHHEEFSDFDMRRTSLDRMTCSAETDGQYESLSPLHLSSQLDETWCRHCDKRHLGGRIVGCPLQNPIQIVSDAVIDFSSNSRSNTSISNREASKSFAQLSIPSILELVPISESLEDEMPQSLTVVAKTRIPALTQFGPLQGELILERNIPEDSSMKDFWLIFTKDLSRVFINTTDPEKSNWFKYVRPATSRRQRNVASLVKNDQLHLVTLRDLEPGEEIVYWIDDPILIWNKSKADKKNCVGCNIFFAHPLHYRMHCVVFHDPQFSMTIRKYHCKICGAAVLGKENIVKHAANQHGGKGAYQCQFCKRFFLRSNYLEMHRQYGCSSNPSRVRPMCDLCGKKFCQPQKLKIHLKRMHGEDCEEFVDDFKCPICDKMLATRHAAIRHQREVHAEVYETGRGYEADRSESNTVDDCPRYSSSLLQVAKVPCPKCPKMFKNKSNLKIHMLTHSGVKPFGCKMEGCQSGFTTKQCLQFHYRKSHGLSDEEMPKIQREIPYTLSAYSGELMDTPGPYKPNKCIKPDRMSRSSSSTECLRRMTQPDLPITRSGSSTSLGGLDTSGSIDKDIYEFQDEETTGSLQSLESAKKEVDLLSVTDKTSLLVVAALCAAEHDLKVSAAAAAAAHISDDSDCEGKSHEDDMADKMSEPYGSPDRGIKEDLGIQISSTELLEHHREIQGTQEHGYSPDEDQQIQRPMEQPLPASTPHLESTHMSDHLSSQQAVYEGYLGTPAQPGPTYRRSPGPYTTSNIFQGSPSSLGHPSSSSRESAGNYAQHFPFASPSARSSSGHSYPGLDLSSRYSSLYRNQGEYTSTSPSPYGRGSTPYSHTHPHQQHQQPLQHAQTLAHSAHQQSEYAHHSAPSDVYYGVPDANSGSIDLSSHGSVSNSPSTASASSASSLFSHHNSMVMRNDHLNCRGETPPPPTSDVLNHFSRPKESLDVMRYHSHSHSHPQSYYPHQVPIHSSRYAPSPGSYHSSTPRLPHLGQSAPYHYGYF